MERGPKPPPSIGHLVKAKEDTAAAHLGFGVFQEAIADESAMLIGELATAGLCGVSAFQAYVANRRQFREAEKQAI